MRTRYLLAGLLSVVLAACTSGAAPSATAEPSAQSPEALAPSPSAQSPEAPAPSPSAQSPEAPAPTATTAVLDVKVTFDGETCTYLGPSAILDGTAVRFEYAPDEQVASSYLMVYGVEPGITFQDLLDHLELYGGEDVSAKIPEWVYQNTGAWTHGVGAMLYTIESVKRDSDDVDYEVGGYQVLCETPAVFPAVQLSVARP